MIYAGHEKYIRLVKYYKRERFHHCVRRAFVSYVMTVYSNITTVRRSHLIQKLYFCPVSERPEFVHFART